MSVRAATPAGVTDPGRAAAPVTAAAVSSLLPSGLIGVVHLAVHPAFALVGPDRWSRAWLLLVGT